MLNCPAFKENCCNLLSTVGEALIFLQVFDCVLLTLEARFGKCVQLSKVHNPVSHTLKWVHMWLNSLFMSCDFTASL